jgi:hypothetical protein
MPSTKLRKNLLQIFKTVLVHLWHLVQGLIFNFISGRQLATNSKNVVASQKFW